MIQPLSLPNPDTVAPPRWLDRMVDEAWQRIDTFMDERPDGMAEQFVASDFDQLYCLLAQAPFHPPAPSATWIEWGSGFGVATAIASRLGWRAQGWEIEPVLHQAAVELAHDFAWTVDLALGDYRQAPPSDLTFAYPWPGEAEAMLTRFEKLARPGDRLLFFRGPEEWQAWEKISP